jgi:hypothetical protein
LWRDNGDPGEKSFHSRNKGESANRWGKSFEPQPVMEVFAAKSCIGDTATNSRDIEEKVGELDSGLKSVNETQFVDQVHIGEPSNQAQYVDGVGQKRDEGQGFGVKGMDLGKGEKGVMEGSIMDIEPMQMPTTTNLVMISNYVVPISKGNKNKVARGVGGKEGNEGGSVRKWKRLAREAQGIKICIAMENKISSKHKSQSSKK